MVTDTTNKNKRKYSREYFIQDYLYALKEDATTSFRGRYKAIRQADPHAKMICNRTYLSYVSTNADVIAALQRLNRQSGKAKRNQPSLQPTLPDSNASTHGTYVFTVGNQRVYHPCKHTVNCAFKFPDMEICPRCTAPQIVADKQNNADKALEDQLKRSYNGTIFHWPSPQQLKVSSLWSEVKEKHDEEFVGWFDELEKLEGFMNVLKQDVIVRYIDYSKGNSDEPSGGPKKADEPKMSHKDMVKIHGGFCPPDVKWRKQQTIHCLTDGSIGLVKFTSGDYCCLDSVRILNESLVSICKKETHQILRGTMGDRAGGAAGYFVPSDNDTNAERSHSISKAVRPDHLLYPRIGYGTGLFLQYSNKKENKRERIEKLNTCYQDVQMSRNDADEKKNLAMEFGCLREKLIKEMKSRLVFLLVAVHYKLEDATSLFTTFGKAVGEMTVKKQTWLNVDPDLSDFDIVLLEYACGTGEMRNHQALAAHTDANNSHPVETMMLFGKVAANDQSPACVIIDDMQDGMLFLPHEHLALRLRCGLDVLHCKFRKTYHVADTTRGLSNWSYVHGP